MNSISSFDFMTGRGITMLRFELIESDIANEIKDFCGQYADLEYTTVLGCFDLYIHVDQMVFKMVNTDGGYRIKLYIRDTNRTFFIKHDAYAKIVIS